LPSNVGRRENIEALQWLVGLGLAAVAIAIIGQSISHAIELMDFRIVRQTGIERCTTAIVNPGCRRRINRYQFAWCPLRAMSADVRSTPKADIRLQRNICSDGFGCSHVSGLFSNGRVTSIAMQPLWLLALMWSADRVPTKPASLYLATTSPHLTAGIFELAALLTLPQQRRRI
jgi:hypothetical protein